MQFVEHDIAQIFEEALRLAISNQQRELLRRRQQQIGRVQLLALPLALWRIASAVLDPHRQAHFADRLRQIALDIDGERLERRNIERVDADEGGAGPDLAAPRDINQRGQESCKRLARTGRRDQQRALSCLGP
ncbi:hypothetical protein ABIE78_005484 [Sinorhizobium fredii]